MNREPASRLFFSIIEIVWTIDFVRQALMGALKILSSPQAWASLLDYAGDNPIECEERQINQAQQRAKYATMAGITDGLGVGITVRDVSSSDFSSLILSVIIITHIYACVIPENILAQCHLQTQLFKFEGV